MHSAETVRGDGEGGWGLSGYIYIKYKFTNSDSLVSRSLSSPASCSNQYFTCNENNNS